MNQESNEPVTPYEKENDEGRVEYKLKLFPKPDEIRLEKLASQMNFRLNEGNGESFYELGIADSGDIVGLPEVEFESSSDVLHEIADKCNADVSLVRKHEVSISTIIGEF